MKQRVLFFVFLVLGSFVSSEPVSLTISRLFSDRAVLQRERPIPVWGTCGAGVEVTVTFGDEVRSGLSDARGRWRVDLAARAADSEGRDLVVSTSDGQERVFSDVVVGDLWLAAGQSNMELGMAAIANRAQEVKDLKVPDLRLYLIPKAASGTDRDQVYGVWVPSDRVSVTSGGWNGFSAVGYTFGRRLQRELGVPVGVLQAAYGGSPIDAWLPPAVLLSQPEFAAYAAEIRDADAAWAQARLVDPAARHPFDDPSDTAALGPGSLWRAMIEPLSPLALRGVLWYQGETDVGNGPFYTVKQNRFIGALRGLFGADLPFYFVQLAPWAAYGDSLPRFWAAQEASLAVPGTGMALTVDVGEADNIHPANKRPVGERLALQALVHTYGRADLRADGPVATGWKARGTDVVVAWTCWGALSSGGQPAIGFEVSQGGTWRSAVARVEGQTVVLTNAAGADSVRYAWSAVPQVNLTDASGLPARPFWLRSAATAQPPSN